MVRFYTTAYDYDYSFPAVCLAYFLRYPNPYSTHIVTIDTVDRHYDPSTQNLTTIRVLLKQSKIPAAALALMPRSILGANEDGKTQSYILEKSTVNIKEGWMKTESRNLEWRNVLDVIESVDYFRPPDAQSMADPLKHPQVQTTDVRSTVALRSHIGENFRKRRARMAEDAASASSADDEAPPKMGFFRSWTTGSVQRTIEMLGLRRTESSQPKAKQGMTLVLERLRQGGVVGVLEGMRQDKDHMLAGQGLFRPAPERNEREKPNPQIDWQDG